MKKSKFLGAILCATLAFVVSASACTTNSTESSSENSSGGTQTVGTNCTVKYAEYQGVKSLTSATEVSSYEADVASNLPDENGIIISPHYTLKANGQEVPVYATRSANGVHSFVYLDIAKTDESKPFALNLEFTGTDLSTVFTTRKGKSTTVAVLPESTGVKATVDQDAKTVEATITEYGSYSFAFNVDAKEAVTVMVKPEDDTAALFGDKTVNYIEPGEYVGEKKNELDFTESNQVYYFKAGKYTIDGIKFPADSVTYFERGCYIEVAPKEDHHYPFHASACDNIVIAGRALIDYSSCCGSGDPYGEKYQGNKGGLVFDQCDNISIAGLQVINSQTWTLCLNDCEGIQINDVMFFAYRTYADGVMLSDCKNAIVENSFIRTGDDAFETKSTTWSGLTDNVLFRHNAAWTDKAVAYGCIYESSHDTRNVRFENNSVGFALGTWSKHLGSCVIQMGNRKGAVMENITFDGMEIYYSKNQAILNVYIGGSGGVGEGWGTVKNIYFKNVTAYRNYGAYLNVRTYSSDDCFIGTLYLDNIVSNGTMLTKENYETESYIVDEVTGGYNTTRYLRINTKLDEDDE